MVVDQPYQFSEFNSGSGLGGGDQHLDRLFKWRPVPASVAARFTYNLLVLMQLEAPRLPEKFGGESFPDFVVGNLQDPDAVVPADLIRQAAPDRWDGNRCVMSNTSPVVGLFQHRETKRQLCLNGPVDLATDRYDIAPASGALYLLVYFPASLREGFHNLLAKIGFSRFSLHDYSGSAISAQ